MTKNEIKTIQSLKQARNRRELGLFAVEGTKLIEELLTSSFIVENIFATEAWIEKNAQFATTLRYENVSGKQMEQMSGMVTPPGILAIARIPRYDIIPEDAKNNIIIALDGINDPGNLGTIIRTADWFGIKNIVCSHDTADYWQQKTIQSAMGSIFRTKIIDCELISFLSKVKSLNIPIFGALMQGKNIFSKETPQNGIIVIGSESHGIKQETLPFITDPIHIPHINGSKTESLNAAVAAAIIMAEFSRKNISQH